MSKILITGAAGFIGSQLSYALWRKGENVVLLDDFSYGHEDNLIFETFDFRKVILRQNICERTSLFKLCEEERFDYIYHIAAITPLPDCQINPGKAIEVNVAGTVNVLEAARTFGCKKVLFASTSAVYENCDKFPTAENDAVTPSLVYSGSKFAAEQFCKSYTEVYGMNVTVLRFANIYGPHIDCLRTQPPVTGYLIRELFYDRAPVLHSNGEQRRDFLFIDDLLELAIRAQEGKGFDCINVSSNKTYSINELFTTVAKTMKKEHIKPEYAHLSNYWKNYPELYRGEYPILEKILDNEVNKFTLCDNTHAKNKYGCKPKIELEDGIKKTVDFTINVLKNQTL